jgi:pSer/pThr/pTyr-binding forkhead associated (FHA) protein
MRRDETASLGPRCLRAMTGPLAGSVFVLEQQLEIGRSSTAAVQLVEPGVSRAHAIVLRDPDSIAVVDMLSTNGTWVHGRRVERALLDVGDTFRIGETELQLDAFDDALEVGGPTIDRIVDARTYRSTARLGLARDLGTDAFAQELRAAQAEDEARAAIPRRVSSLLTDIVVFRTLHVRATRGEIADPSLRVRYDQLSRNFLKQYENGASTFIRFDVNLPGRLEFEDARADAHGVDISDIGVDGARVVMPPRVVDDYSLCWLSVPMATSLGLRAIVFTARVLSSKAKTLDVLFTGAPSWANHHREVSTDFFAKTVPLEGDDKKTDKKTN